MNTKYSNWKMWYYVLCMVLTLQLAACSEETHDEYTAAPEIEDTYIDQLDALIAEMTDLQQNSDYGDKKGQYPTESRAILTDAIDDANRAVLLIKYQQPSPSESEKQRYVAEAKASIEQFKSTIRTEDAETTPAELFVDGRGDGGSYIDFARSSGLPGKPLSLYTNKKCCHSPSSGAFSDGSQIFPPVSPQVAR